MCVGGGVVCIIQCDSLQLLDLSETILTQDCTQFISLKKLSVCYIKLTSTRFLRRIFKKNVWHGVA